MPSIVDTTYIRFYEAIGLGGNIKRKLKVLEIKVR